MAVVKTPPRKEHWCIKCDRLVNAKDFYYNYNSIHTNNRMSYCKECCKTIGKDIINKAYNFEVGIRNLCAFFDMPFNYSAFDLLTSRVESATTNRDFTYVYQYMECLKECEIPNEEWDDLTGNNYIVGKIIKSTKITGEYGELILKLQEDWGLQEHIDDYLFLEEHFKMYSNGETLTPSMKQTIRYLCLAELEVIKLKNKKEDSKDAEKKVMGYYKTLKLDNFTTIEGKSAGEKMLEKWTAIEENTRPLDMIDKLFADDICKIREDNDHLMRAMKNLVTGSRDYPDLN